MSTVIEGRRYKQIAVYCDDAGRRVSYPVTGRAPVPTSIVSAGDVLTLRMIQHVPVLTDAEMRGAEEGVPENRLNRLNAITDRATRVQAWGKVRWGRGV